MHIAAQHEIIMLRLIALWLCLNSVAVLLFSHSSLLSALLRLHWCCCRTFWTHRHLGYGCHRRCMLKKLQQPRDRHTYLSLAEVHNHP